MLRGGAGSCRRTALSGENIFDNLVFYAVFQSFIFGVTQSAKLALIAEFTVSFVLHAANQIILLVRSTPLVPTDLLVINTAMSVTSPTSGILTCRCL